jgi:hypothetical protein
VYGGTDGPGYEGWRLLISRLKRTWREELSQWTTHCTGTIWKLEGQGLSKMGNKEGAILSLSLSETPSGGGRQLCLLSWAVRSCISLLTQSQDLPSSDRHKEKNMHEYQMRDGANGLRMLVILKEMVPWLSC